MATVSNAISDGKFHQDVAQVEKRYSRKWIENMLTDLNERHYNNSTRYKRKQNELMILYIYIYMNILENTEFFAVLNMSLLEMICVRVILVLLDSTGPHKIWTWREFFFFVNQCNQIIKYEKD